MTVLRLAVRSAWRVIRFVLLLSLPLLNIGEACYSAKVGNGWWTMEHTVAAIGFGALFIVLYLGHDESEVLA